MQPDSNRSERYIVRVRALGGRGREFGVWDRRQQDWLRDSSYGARSTAQFMADHANTSPEGVASDPRASKGSSRHADAPSGDPTTSDAERGAVVALSLDEIKLLRRSLRWRAPDPLPAELTSAVEKLTRAQATIVNQMTGNQPPKENR